MRKVLFYMGLMFLAGSSFAKNPDVSSNLTKFLNLKTLQANFEQTTFSGKKSRTSAGVIKISRPNKFSMEYTKAGEEQLIVSDAKKIYIYDQPLAQVTVRKFDQSLDKSPATLLAGGNNINGLYQITNLNSKTESLSWVKLVPKNIDENNGFKQVLMGFDQGRQLIRMNFVDSFDNQTQIKFSAWQLGKPIAESEFQFKIPKGVDVIEQ